MNNNIKYIEVRGKEWTSPTYGVSYFSARIIVTFDRDVKVFNIPFTNGYGNQYIQSAYDLLRKENIMYNDRYYHNLNWYCRENNIELYTTIKTNCKKKDVKNLDPYTF